MVFGLIAAKSCFLTEISRELNEDIALDKTVERLSRNLMSFDGSEGSSYLAELKTAPTDKPNGGRCFYHCIQYCPHNIDQLLGLTGEQKSKEMER